MPVYRTPLRYLRLMVASVFAQTDTDFELIIVDDGSGEIALTAELETFAQRDPRVRLAALEHNGGIVRASAHGLMLATGAFVALLDHDDELLPNSLASFRQVIEADENVDYLYSDETITDPEGQVLGEFRKPDFSPVRLLGQMYTGHLAVYRRSLLEQIGGFREGFEGSQDYDLALRVSERARTVAHISECLYRWRTLPTSVSHAGNNEHVFAAAGRALTEHLGRTSTPGTVVQTDSTGRYRIDRELPTNLRVDLVVPSTGGRTFAGGADRPALPALLDALRPAVDHLGDVGVIVAYQDDPGVAVQQAWPGRWLGLQHPASSGPAAVNRSVAASTADIVVVALEGLAELSGADLTRLVSLACDRRIGAVGPRILDGAGRLSSAGLTFASMRPLAIGAGCEAQDPGPFGALQLDREVLALAPGILVVERTLFMEVGGLSVRMTLVAALIDFCFKTAATGRSAVICATDAVFDRPVGLPTAGQAEEIARRWRRRVAHDPYWV